MVACRCSGIFPGIFLALGVALLAWVTISAEENKEKNKQKKAVNLIANPSFEEVETKPAHWVLAAVAEGGKARLSASDDNPKAGKHCIRIQGEAEWATFVSNRIPLEKGKKYVLTGWVRVKKGNGYIKIDYFDNDKYLDMTMAEPSDSSEWTKQQVETEAEKLEKATHLTATLVGTGEFEVYFDELHLEAQENRK